MIEITVSELIEAELDEVFKVLLNIKDYKNWWLVPVEKIEGKKNMFKFSPLNFVEIVLIEDYHIKNKELQFKYVKGPFRGTGKWELKKHPIKGLLSIKYTIKLKPINLLIGLLANTKLFRKKHSTDILNIIKNIEKIKKKPNK